MPKRQTLKSVALIGAGIALAATSFGAPQESLKQTLEEKASRLGVFFRADAPRVLRNPDDPNLPLYLEIINGVEKAGHSAARSLSNYFNRNSLNLQGVKIFLKPSGANRNFPDEVLQLSDGTEFSYDTRKEGTPFLIPNRMKKTLEIPRSAIKSYLEHYFIGGPFDFIDLKVSFIVADWPAQDFYLRVRLNALPLPKLPNWFRGDVHYHSAYTDNPAERGNPLSVTKQTALQSDLSWVVLADHSTDLADEGYEKELQEVKSFRDGRFLFIRGEEVTVASASQANLTTLHTLAFPSPDDPDRGFPAAGQSGTAILTGDGSPGSAAMPLKDALSRVVGAGGFAYAAHPFDPISPILRGGSWDLELDFLAADGKGLQAGLVGLEPWNRGTTRTADDARDPYCLRQGADPTTCFQPDKDADQFTRLSKGIELGWQPLLNDGLKSSGSSPDSPPFKVFMAAGSDAHGDFNYEATMDALDFLSKPMRGLSGYAEDNALGKLATVVFCPQGMGPRGENVLRALKNGGSVLSNGPLLVAGVDSNGNGSIEDPGDITIGQQYSPAGKEILPLQVQWVSNEEIGPLRSLSLIVGTKAGERKPVEIGIPARMALASDGLYPIDLGSYLANMGMGWVYVRLVARTLNGAGEEFRCYTNPIWIHLLEH